MNNIEKILQEIERLKNKNAEWRERINSEDGYSYESDVCCGYDEAIEDFETFINSLSEEKPSEDLEEAAENCVWNSIDSNDPTLVPKFIPLLLSLFISGAYWQKEQMTKVSEEDALLLERAWLTLDNFGHEELAEWLRQFVYRQK